MRLKIFLIAAVLAVCVQGAVFAKGIAEERAASDKRAVSNDYDALAEQANANIEAGDYAAAIPLLKLMHELKPGELAPIEYLGNLYTHEDRPEFHNALFWLTEAEKRGSSNSSVYYNLACIYSLRGEIEKAEAEMDKAFALGFSNFEWISQDDDLVNFRTGSLWEGIADNYTQIEQLLALLDEFTSNEEEKSITDRITFYSGIVTFLKELAPHIPALQSRPLFFLAHSYENMGNYALAEQNYLETKAIYEKVVGKEHPYYATTLSGLGVHYCDISDYAKAERYLLEAAAILEKALVKEHPYYA
ncbi:tetratricopeptide repeat protein, partial [Treponema sp. R8-4-B8]